MVLVVFFLILVKIEVDIKYLTLELKQSFAKFFSFLLKGIYRVCGNKVKTEKLCQALENGMHLVDISEFSSHDICDVLKLYLRQVKFLPLKLNSR